MKKSQMLSLSIWDFFYFNSFALSKFHMTEGHISLPSGNFTHPKGEFHWACILKDARPFDGLFLCKAFGQILIKDTG